MLESAIQKKILDYLKTVPNCWTVKTVHTNKLGCPDILACIEGRFYGLEVKQDKGIASAIQLRQLKNISDAGGISAIVRSVDDVKAILTKGIK